MRTRKDLAGCRPPGRSVRSISRCRSERTNDRHLTETGSYPLGDSSVLTALRYATGATHRNIKANSLWPTTSDDRGIEVKQ